jgi:predicted DNA-binding protein
MRAVGRARSIRFRPDQDPRLKQRAAELGRAEADLVREALDEKMAREGW